MTARSHEYDVTIAWTENRGQGTRSYDSHDRTHEVTSAAASVIAGFADPALRGDATRWNPAQLLVVSLSQCHMLWSLHLASVAGIVVTGYEDHAHGVMAEEASGAGTSHP